MWDGDAAALPTRPPPPAQSDLGWYAIVALVRTLTPDECLEPGYYRDPDWSVRDLVAHLGTWLAEAQAEFERMSAGTYEAHEVDVDALNARFHAAMARDEARPPQRLGRP